MNTIQPHAIQQPTFQGTLAIPPERKLSDGFTRMFDFEKLGETPVKQTMLLYALIIGSRIISEVMNGLKIQIPGADGETHHSFSGAREVLIRDTQGYLSWFFLTLGIQKAGMLAFTPQKYRDILVHTPYKAQNNSWLEKLRETGSYLWGGSVPTADQIRDRATQFKIQADHAIEKAKAHITDPQELETLTKALTKEQEHLLQALVEQRNLSKALGIAFTIVYLGIGIMYANIGITRVINAALGHTSEDNLKPSTKETISADALNGTNTTTLAPAFTSSEFSTLYANAFQ